MPRSVTRRTVLRGGGVAVALPLLGAMRASRSAGIDEAPRRMVAIQTNMGILPQFFFPERAGRDYVPTPYLERLAPFRDDFTVFSGTSLPGVVGGHVAEKCFLTGTPHPERGGFRNGISLDQFAAERIGVKTRHPSLVLAVTGENATLSYTRSGVPIPAETSPRRLFDRLFVQGDARESQSRTDALREERSLLDAVHEEARRLAASLPADDRRRLDDYLTAVRELERRLAAAEEWEARPKPSVTVPAPRDIDDPQAFVERTQLMLDVIALALRTDSTRVVSLFIDTTVIHQITHHGNRPELIAELRGKEERQFDALARFLGALRSSDEAGTTLLDRTMVLYGTCMGSANSHSNLNLPVLLAGGGFRHGSHLSFDPVTNYPLSNLYVSMLQRLGIEVDAFSTGSGTMRGLEAA